MSQPTRIVGPEGTTYLDKANYASVMSNIRHLFPGSACSLRVDAEHSSSSPGRCSGIQIELTLDFKDKAGGQTIGDVTILMVEKAGERSMSLLPGDTGAGSWLAGQLFGAEPAASRSPAEAPTCAHGLAAQHALRSGYDSLQSSSSHNSSSSLLSGPMRDSDGAPAQPAMPGTSSTLTRAVACPPGSVIYSVMCAVGAHVALLIAGITDTAATGAPGDGRSERGDAGRMKELRDMRSWALRVLMHDGEMRDALITSMHYKAQCGAQSTGGGTSGAEQARRPADASMAAAASTGPLSSSSTATHNSSNSSSTGSKTSSNSNPSMADVLLCPPLDACVDPSTPCSWMQWIADRLSALMYRHQQSLNGAPGAASIKAAATAAFAPARPVSISSMERKSGGHTLIKHMTSGDEAFKGVEQEELLKSLMAATYCAASQRSFLDTLECSLKAQGNSRHVQHCAMCGRSCAGLKQLYSNDNSNRGHNKTMTAENVLQRCASCMMSFCAHCLLLEASSNAGSSAAAAAVIDRTKMTPTMMREALLMWPDGRCSTCQRGEQIAAATATTRKELQDRIAAMAAALQVPPVDATQLAAKTAPLPAGMSSSSGHNSEPGSIAEASPVSAAEAQAAGGPTGATHNSSTANSKSAALAGGPSLDAEVPAGAAINNSTSINAALMAAWSLLAAMPSNMRTVWIDYDEGITLPEWGKLPQSMQALICPASAAPQQ